VDARTGKRVQVKDPDTGALIDQIDDRLLADMQALIDGKTTETLRFVDAKNVSLRCAVPVYHDQRYIDAYRSAMKGPRYNGFKSATLGDLVKQGMLEIRGGHGSPSHEERIGTVPYIKVSDLRAGLVNINPTNRVPRAVAETFWKGKSSGLRAFDLVCPERTSKNIGDFCVLMPGQEQVVATKEIIVLRPGPAAQFDPFYLLWAMTLVIVRDQWKRVVFMQTNREDVGGRYLEIEIPVPPNKARADKVSKPFRDYFMAIANARGAFADYLAAHNDHHFFVSGAEEIDAQSEASAEPEQAEGAL
jgi:type I restriction enzyme M protein